MANPSKQKGTAFETAVVRHYDAEGIDAKRIVLHGNKDQGDIDVGEYNIEAKNCNAISLGTWIKEAEVEAVNAGKPVVVVAKRKGITDPAKSYVITTLDTWIKMVHDG